MRRGRKKSHILETMLGGKVFITLMTNPRGISGYEISKITFGIGTQGKIYSILKELEKKKLAKKTIKGYKPRYDGLVEVLNSFIPNEFKLNTTEKKRLESIFKKTKWDLLLPVEAKSMNLLEFFKAIIAMPCSARLAAKIIAPTKKVKFGPNITKKYEKVLSKERIEEMTKFYLELFKFPISTLNKLVRILPPEESPIIMKKLGLWR